MLSADRSRHNPSNSSSGFLEISTVLFPFEQLLGNSVIRHASDDVALSISDVFPNPVTEQCLVMCDFR